MSDVDAQNAGLNPGSTAQIRCVRQSARAVPEERGTEISHVAHDLDPLWGENILIGQRQVGAVHGGFPDRGVLRPTDAGDEAKTQIVPNLGIESFDGDGSAELRAGECSGLNSRPR